MRRKVIQIAQSTQLISLPRKWALAHDIKKGDELNISEEGNKLVVSTETGPHIGKVEVDITGLDRDSIMYLLRALYKNGYDDMTIRFKKPLCENIRAKKQEKVTDVITREISRLNGVEIFSQKEDYCVIRSISEDTIKAFDTMLRRIFLLTSETFSELIEGYEKGNLNILETVQAKHDTITKLVSYSQRLLNKVGYQNYKKTDIIYHVLEIIDTILDLAKYNARGIINFKIKASPEGTQICRAIHQQFDLFYDLYYNFTLEKVYELNKNRYFVIKNLEQNQNKIQKNELSILANMEQVLEYILNLTNARIALQY